MLYFTYDQLGLFLFLRNLYGAAFLAFLMILLNRLRRNPILNLSYTIILLIHLLILLINIGLGVCRWMFSPDVHSSRENERNSLFFPSRVGRLYNFILTRCSTCAVLKRDQDNQMLGTPKPPPYSNCANLSCDIQMSRIDRHCSNNKVINPLINVRNYCMKK